MSKQYAERDASSLDEAGGYYIRHVSAMTKGGLHSKSDIAAELGFRDMRIDQLNHRINQLLTERNATGLAIDHALSGVLPEQHGLLSRLQMLSLVAAQRDELLDALSGLVDFIEIDDLNIDALALKIAKDAIAKTKGGAVNHFPDAAKMVPEGWQLVPVEPTLEMIAAATRDSVGFGTRAEYKAMLASAPKHEGGAA
ncbi:hypothetical protein [Pseudaeromonas pectinilytica]